MRTALLQSSGRPGSVVENLKVLDEAAGRAAAAGAGLLVAPEMFLTGYAIGDDVAPAGRARRRRLRRRGRRDRRPARARRRLRLPRAATATTRVFNSAQLIGRRRRPARELPQDPPLRRLRARLRSPPATQPVVQAELDGVTRRPA